MKAILIVEDDIYIHNLMKELLENTYKIYDAYSGTEVLLVLEKVSVDLIILDLMLPGLAGEELIQKLYDIPILVVSAKSSVEDKVNTLHIGARDYITKPFHNEEFVERVAVQLRATKGNKTLEYRELRLDTKEHFLYVGENPVGLTRVEFSIMKQLLFHTNQILSKSTLLDLIFDDTNDCDENSLKVHISNIRKKIRQFSNEDYIESVWGIGYKLK